MSLPLDACVTLEIDLSAFLDLKIDLPGGVALTAKLEAGKFPSLPDIVASLLGQLNAALTPLMPFFNMLDVVLALIECVKAIPDALGPPPDPTKVVKCLKKLLKAAAKLLNLIPPLSVPLMIVGICKTIVASMMALIQELEHMLTVQASLDLATARAQLLAQDPDTAAGAALLQASIDCAQADVDLQAEVSATSLGPVNKFIDLLNALAGLAGLPELGKVEASGDASAMLDPLKTFVEVLNSFCGAIPV